MPLRRKTKGTFTVLIGEVNKDLYGHRLFFIFNGIILIDLTLIRLTAFRNNVKCILTISNQCRNINSKA